MTYHIARDGQQIGIFEEEQLPAAIETGELLLTDLAWSDGMPDWEPLSDLVDVEILEEEEEAQDAMPTTPPLPRSAPPIPMPTLPPLPASERALPGSGVKSGLAVASLVLGIASLIGGCITGVPAIIMGAVALNKITKSNGTLEGKGMAITGLALGAFLAITGTAFLAGLLLPAYNVAAQKAHLIQSSSNARQIVLVLRNYAGDHNGSFPDSSRDTRPATSNDAFRELFKAGLLEDEKIFSAAHSPYSGDNRIGEVPYFASALEPRENHWAMTRGLTDSASGRAPLVFENPVPGAAGPPRWNADKAGQPVPGRAWKGGKIIIARADGSAAAEQLEQPFGEAVPLAPGPEGTDLFAQFVGQQGEILDVAR